MSAGKHGFFFCHLHTPVFGLIPLIKTIIKKQERRCKNSFSGKKVIIRESKRNEFKRFDESLEKHHYIGKSASVGDSMRTIAEIDTEWVGLLMWGSACHCLKDREMFIGWTNVQQVQRQKLVVKNRRFSLLLNRSGINTIDHICAKCNHYFTQLI